MSKEQTKNIRFVDRDRLAPDGACRADLALRLSAVRELEADHDHD